MRWILFPGYCLSALGCIPSPLPACACVSGPCTPKEVLQIWSWLSQCIQLLAQWNTLLNRGWSSCLYKELIIPSLPDTSPPLISEAKKRGLKGEAPERTQLSASCAVRQDWDCFPPLCLPNVFQPKPGKMTLGNRVFWASWTMAFLLWLPSSHLICSNRAAFCFWSLQGTMLRSYQLISGCTHKTGKSSLARYLYFSCVNKSRRDLEDGVDGQEKTESDSQGNNVFLPYIQRTKQHMYTHTHTLIRLKKQDE